MSTDALLAITVIWGFVFIYAVMATMDFGAGFWSMVYINKPQTNATNIANRYLSPTWEVTNVFIVAIVVALFSFFPGATFILGTVLLIPGSAILLLLAIRSGFLVFSHVAKDYQKALTYISGISGFIIPGILMLVLPITHGKYIEMVNGNYELNLTAVVTSPNIYAFAGFAISSTLYLSSLLLADYSNAAEDLDAYKVYRRDALIMGPISIIMALLIMFTLRYEANWLFTEMMENLPWLFGSVGMFLLAGLSLFLPSTRHASIKGRPRLAVIAATIQYFLASYAYGQSHLPYMIYPDVTIESGFTHPATFRALFASYIVGFIILFPGFVYFWRLFMKDRRYLKQDKT
ncbi:cytochrome bd-I ubiquinol oxidase subunit 2 apoprotein [Bacillus oleivorans]|uniref:Cytochrome bd-I ubiquinol oxidase subunit 2 apoprotein n=1 Tax=Bacillus oleivorans TaxID=1448271 RepID=A0A285CHK8_9BACI|nr:cytochrome d ubiquinol oxidase subunit II [Bacillus oleivorans]SNX66825.1 cytochrome bd-I ubiquinol oxidase subunit 2 apoprotein [Bacillus oleivorans]